MAAQTLGSSTTTTAAARVNLLPPEIAEHVRLRKAQVAMVGTGLAAVAVVGALYMQQTAKVSEAEQSKADAVATNVQLRGDLAKLQHIQQTRTDVDNARLTLATAMKNEVLWSKYLHDVTLTIPETVWLTNFTVAMTEGAQGATAPGGGQSVLDPGLGTVSITGVAMTHNDVAAWLESLARQKGYANAYFTQASDARINETEVVNFTSSASVTEAALSNQYTKGPVR